MYQLDLPRYHCFNCFNLRLKKDKKLYVYCKKGMLEYGKFTKFRLYNHSYKNRVFTTAEFCMHFDDREVYE